MLTDQMRRSPIIIRWMCAACVALGACSTQEISADPVVIPDSNPSADHGALTIGFAPPEVTFEEEQANSATRTNPFHLFIDGKQLAWWSMGRPPEPFMIIEGGTISVGYLPGGSHHFEIRAAAG